MNLADAALRIFPPQLSIPNSPTEFSAQYPSVLLTILIVDQGPTSIINKVRHIFSSRIPNGFKGDVKPIKRKSKGSKARMSEGGDDTANRPWVVKL